MCIRDRLWHILLLLIGVRAAEPISRAKAWSVALFTVIAFLLIRALPALIAAQFDGLTVVRPFF